MSKLGFGDVARKMAKIEKEFLRDGVRLAQKEFKENFDSTVNQESKVMWMGVKRDVPPEILDVTGRLKNESIHNIPIITPGRAELTIDPTDDRGRNYAAYHEESPSQGNNIQREFVTSSKGLEDAQERLLISLLDKAFR